jgi:hypothetical protein
MRWILKESNATQGPLRFEASVTSEVFALFCLRFSTDGFFGEPTETSSWLCKFEDSVQRPTGLVLRP